MAHPSSALIEFDVAISAAERLAVLERRYNDPPTPTAAPTVRALRGGFCVLVVGTFERFLSDAFEEQLADLVALPPPVAFADLPHKLRMSTIFESLEYAMKGPRYGGPGGQAVRLGDVVSAARRIVSENIDPSALAQTRGNPDARCVRRMFAALGVVDAFVDTRPAFDAAWRKPEASSFVSDKLDEIVNARHVVAHTANALAITRGDLRDWPGFLRVLARVLDARLDRYLRNVLSQVTPP